MSEKNNRSEASFSYADAGVDINAGNTLVERIKPYAAKTAREEVLNGLGGFGAMFELPLERYKKPVLVSSTDGVGTKLKLATQTKRYDTIGIDLVAMCVNDLIVQGAEPLFFLDYYATGKLHIDQASAVIKGIADGCQLAGCALIGGESAEMPGMYHGGDYDLAGFSVGIVEKDRIITSDKVCEGDVLLGLASSGPHSNGYSLIRKILEHHRIDLSESLTDTTLAEALLAPTRIYVKSLLQLIEQVDVHALAHITGGGLLENIPRVLPEYSCAKLDSQCWQQPEIFAWLQQQGNISSYEMYRTFNCGIGMVIAIAADQAQTACQILQDNGENVAVIGYITHSDKPSVEVNIV